MAFVVKKTKALGKSIIAGEDISIGNVVCIKDGKIYKADSTDSTKKEPVGVSNSRALTGDKVEVVLEGVVGGLSGLTIGQKIYLGANGAVETSGNINIGIAITATEFELLIGQVDSDPNTIVVRAGESLQEAVDTAVANGANWANPTYIETSSLAVIDVARDEFTGQVLTSTGAVANGVILVDEKKWWSSDIDPQVTLTAPAIMVRIDDIRKRLIMLAEGKKFVRDISGTRTSFYLPDGTAKTTDHNGTTDTSGFNLWNQTAATNFNISQNELVDSLPIDADTKCVRLQLVSATIDGELGYILLTTPVNMTNMQYFSCWVQLEFGNIPEGVLQIGFSESQTAGTATYIDIPIPPNNGLRTTITLDLPANIKAMTAVTSIWFKLTAPNPTFVFKLYNPRVASHPFIGISPIRYASQKGIPITHACIVDEIGANSTDSRTALMNYDELWKAVNARGNELAAHTQYGYLNSPIFTEPNMARALECTIGTREKIEALKATTTTYFVPSAIGAHCDGYIQPGDNETTGLLNTTKQMDGWFGQLVQKYFGWANAYVTRNKMKFGNNHEFYASAFITNFPEASPPTNDVVVYDHYFIDGDLNESGSSSIDYDIWKTLIDRISIWQEAGKVVAVTGSTYYYANRPLIYPATTGAQRQLIRGGDCDNVTIGFNSASNVSVVNGKFRFAANALGSIFTDRLPVKNMQRYELTCDAVTSTGNVVFEILVAFYYKDSSGNIVLGTSIPIYKGYISNSSSVIGGCFSVPSWCYEVKTQFRTKLPTGVTVDIDNVKMRQI